MNERNSPLRADYGREFFKERRPLTKNIRLSRSAPAYAQKVLGRACEITGSFEGKGFQQVTGDFDGQGLSCGILQWCLGQGSLQRLMREAYKMDKSCFNAFDDLATLNGKSYQDLVYQVMQGKADWKFLARVTNGNKKRYTVPKKYRTQWENFLTHPATRDAQVYLCRVVADRAAMYCRRYEWESARAFYLCFDIVTQNGGINKSAPAWYKKHINPLMDEFEQLKVMAFAISKKCNPRWSQDVLARKLAVARGEGTVHGKRYSESKYGVKPEDTWMAGKTQSPRLNRMRKEKGICEWLKETAGKWRLHINGTRTDVTASEE